MRQDSISLGLPAAWALPAWLPAALLMGATAVLGPSLGSAARPLFIVGCGAVGWMAWRRDPAAHLQSVLALFAFAAFLRRLVDVGAGYDVSGLMLVGPLLALMVAGIDLLRPDDGLAPRRSPETLAPMVLVAGCVLYAVAISLFQGDWMNAVSNLVKWCAPLIYAAALVRSRTSSAALLSAAASAFLVIVPIMGLYGIVQYTDPPVWDRYWMSYAPIMSAGEPIPYGVRTYSTMNGPASFATFTAAGLLLICFLGSGWRALLCAAPAAPALLLSTYRTAWISLALGIVFCCFFASTRRRALGTLCGGLLAVVLTAVLTPFGAVISDRIASLGGGAQDGSAQERIGEFYTLWNQWDSGLLGHGFTSVDVGSAGAVPVDGMIVSCWLCMGIVVGLLCLVGLLWAIGNAVSASVRDRGRDAVVVGALACGALSQMPLANIASGELGFLFWTFAVLLPPAAAMKVAAR